MKTRLMNTVFLSVCLFLAACGGPKGPEVSANDLVSQREESAKAQFFQAENTNEWFWRRAENGPTLFHVELDKDTSAKANWGERRREEFVFRNGKDVATVIIESGGTCYRPARRMVISDCTEYTEDISDSPLVPYQCNPKSWVVIN